MATPPEETITVIAEWPVREFESFAALMGFVEKAWRYPEFFYVDEKGEYHLSTGGWSGNEDLIQAMQGNLVFWGVCWLESRCGGHFKFRLPQRKMPAPAEKD